MTTEAPFNGEDLRAIRLGLGLSQLQFATKLGLSRVYVGLLERGIKPVTERTKIAAFGLRPKPIERPLGEFDPLSRQIEAELLSNGLDFVRQFPSGGMIFDFFLPEFELAINVQREQSEAFRPTPEVRGLIAATGKNAIEILALILGGRPVRMAKPIITASQI